MNYFEFWIDDYVGATGELSLEEYGAYLKLMLHYYAKNKPLPPGYKALYKICSAISRGEQKTVRKIADEFFPIDPNGLRSNPKCEEVCQRFANRSSLGRERANKRKNIMKERFRDLRAQWQERREKFYERTTDNLNRRTAMTDLKKYAEGVKLPVRYEGFSGSVGILRDADNKPIASNIRFWGWLTGREEEADAFGYWLAEQINKGLEEVRG